MAEAVNLLRYDEYAQSPETGRKKRKNRRSNKDLAARRARIEHKAYDLPETGGDIMAVVASYGQEGLIGRDYSRFDQRSRVREAVQEDAAAVAIPKPAVVVRPVFKLSFLWIMTFICAAGLLFMVVMSHVELSELTNEAARMKGEISALKKEEKRLAAEYEGYIDLREIEERAFSMGMIRPADEQIVYVDAICEDNAEVLEKPASGFMAVLDELIDSIMEYIG